MLAQVGSRVVYDEQSFVLETRSNALHKHRVDFYYNEARIAWQSFEEILGDDAVSRAKFYYYLGLLGVYGQCHGAS